MWIFRRKGSPYWYAVFNAGGQTIRRTTGQKDEAKARQIGHDLEREAKRRFSRREGQLFSTACERYFTQMKPHLSQKTLANYQVSLRNIFQEVGSDFALSEVNWDFMDLLVRRRLVKTGTVAVRRDLAFFSSLFRTAQLWPDGPKLNPAKSYDKRHLREATPRKRWLTEEEVESLLAACPTERHRAIVTIAVETGMRRGEILGLRWSEVDLVEGQVTLMPERTKTAEGRIIPLTARAAAALIKLQWADQGKQQVFVFENGVTGKPQREIKKFFDNACRKAGLADLHFHDLRHTFASWALQRGVQEQTVQHWLGHKTRSMTQRYVHLRVEDLRRGRDVFEAARTVSVRTQGPHDFDQAPATASDEMVDISGIVGGCAGDRTRGLLIKSQMLYR